MVLCTLHMHVSDGDCPEFREVPISGKRGKIVISVKNPNLFSRSRMMKQISPLESSREI